MPYLRRGSHFVANGNGVNTRAFGRQRDHCFTYQACSAGGWLRRWRLRQRTRGKNRTYGTFSTGALNRHHLDSTAHSQLDELGQSRTFEFAKDTLDPLLLPFFQLAIFDSIRDL